MDARYSIIRARLQDLQWLPAIELAAAQLLQSHAPAAVASPITDLEEFEHAHANGLLWVVLAEDRPVGFALVEILASGLPHLEEIDVHPQHGQRGLGTALMKFVCDWPRQAGHTSITLTTFRGVPWNMPFYARLGFEEIPASKLSPELVAIVRDEETRGLDPDRRVVMRYNVRLPTDSSGSVQ